MSIKHCFILSSATNTKFGVYNANDRLIQTVITIRSIKQKIPDAKIVVVEMAGVSPTEQQVATLTSESDIFLDYTEEESVRNIYNSTDNWDVVKNGTEIMVFGAALKMLKEDGEFEGIDRIHKISGRYVINDNFKPELFEGEDAKEKIVIAKRRLSQFPPEITNGQKFQYMSRLWSWPVALLDDIIAFYETAMQDFVATVTAGKYLDIEHLLAKHLPSQHIHEVSPIGIEGLIGPNGTAVKD